ncbi:MAG: glycosyltransferase [Elusimicrobia bacterium]|nr:glycosyltransferase [Elusimicrobiota bacterium]
MIPKISVIIPVYNVEKYLKECVDSVINQTYKNLEIILVDDGSTDDSGKMCDKYALEDKRIQVIHKENGGLSDARNKGIQKATGEYISFIDSDDTVELDIFEYLYNILKKFNCNLSICAHTIYKYNAKKIFFKLKHDEKISSHDCIKKMLDNEGINVGAWAKLYKRELFNNIQYPKGHLFEDIPITYKLFIRAGNIASGHLAKYNYKKRKESITLNYSNYATLDLIKSTDIMGRGVVKEFPDLKRTVFRRRIYERFVTLNNMLYIDKEHREKINKIIYFLNKYTCTLLMDRDVSFKKKCAILLLRINYKLYKFVCKIYVIIWEEMLHQNIS